MSVDPRETVWNESVSEKVPTITGDAVSERTPWELAGGIEEQIEELMLSNSCGWEDVISIAGGPNALNDIRYWASKLPEVRVPLVTGATPW